MKIKRAGKMWVVPAVTITPSTIPGRFIVKRLVGRPCRRKVHSFEQAKSVALSMAQLV